MMNRTHTLSGGVSWLAGCATLAAAGHPPSNITVGVGALVAAGSAIIPDVDHPGSTIAHTLGPVTRLLARLVSWTGGAIRRVTCGCCEPDGGHRAVTHTALFAVILGGLVSLLGWRLGHWAGLGTVWLATGLGARAMLTRKACGAFGAVLLATIITLAVHVTSDGGWWWVGVPVAWGTFAHSVGDSLTHHGSPLLWPLRLRGCRWTMVGSPRWMRFRTGRLAEKVIFSLLFLAGLGISGWLLTAGGA
jgi:membrane-bound metal-dependent hydrolase YbcI (DUF457 family)